MEHEFYELQLWDVGLSLIISVIVAGILGFSMHWNRRSLDQSKDSTYSKLLNDLSKEIMDHEKSFFKIDSTFQCKDFARHYISIHNRMALLHQENSFPLKYMDDFNDSFCTAQTLYEWLEKVVVGDDIQLDEMEHKSDWDAFFTHVTKIKISSYPNWEFHNDKEMQKRMEKKYDQMKKPDDKIIKSIERKIELLEKERDFLKLKLELTELKQELKKLN